MRTAAVIVAAGRGLRMGGPVPKQYMEIGGMPVICHTLTAFEESSVDDIVIVCGRGDEAYVDSEIVNKYGFGKVRCVVCGGAERFDSCFEGIKAAAALPEKPERILVHDGVRALVTPSLINRVADALDDYPAVCPMVPVKDTVRRVDENGMSVETPDRSSLRAVQTPQGFRTDIILRAYEAFFESEGEDGQTPVTDDCMLVERYLKLPIKAVEGSFLNIKLTTPEDLLIAGALLSSNRAVRDARLSGGH